MKIEITKTFTAVLDTDRERNRIRKVFKGENKEKLEEFLDAIETLDFVKVQTLLESKWWNGRDEECECFRLEFLGFLFNPKNAPDGFDCHSTYLNLACACLQYPENYKLKVKE